MVFILVYGILFVVEYMYNTTMNVSNANTNEHLSKEEELRLSHEELLLSKKELPEAMGRYQRATIAYDTFINTNGLPTSPTYEFTLLKDNYTRCSLRVDTLTQHSLTLTQRVSDLEKIILNTSESGISSSLPINLSIVPAFQPLTYSLQLYHLRDQPFDDSIEIFERDDLLMEINKVFEDRLKAQKYRPVLITTSRGMGKTFLLKKLAKQQVKEDCKSPLIERAGKCGRILTYSFRTDSKQMDDDDILSFFPRLMIDHLCRMFDGVEVDGIHFEKVKIANLFDHPGRQMKFREWLNRCKYMVNDDIISEFIRLTKIAFGINDDIPPVFLLDEIQNLQKESLITSKRISDSIHMHTHLSLLLTQLAGQFEPLCVCTGTNDGAIVSIVDMSIIAPRVLSLTPILKSQTILWNQITQFMNSRSARKISEQDDLELIKSLINVSYSIPRLLFIAHDAWYGERRSGEFRNSLSVMEVFEKQAAEYYIEMAQILKLFKIDEICHILLACSVHYRVPDVYSHVPGTIILWTTLIQKSLVFPSTDHCFIFPFSLMWKIATSPRTTNHRKEIVDRCEQLIKNLHLPDLFITYDDLCAADYSKQGTIFEKLFVSSLAVKYYLRRLNSDEDHIPFSMICECDESNIECLNVNFSDGIFLPLQQVRADSNETYSVVHNTNIKHAHHDIIFSARTKVGFKNEEKLNVAVQCKASFSNPTRKVVDRQLLVDPKSTRQVERLFWISLGPKIKHPGVTSLDGSGCISSFSLSILKSEKILKSGNQLI